MSSSLLDLQSNHVVRFLPPVGKVDETSKFPVGSHFFKNKIPSPQASSSFQTAECADYGPALPPSMATIGPQIPAHLLASAPCGERSVHHLAKPVAEGGGARRAMPPMGKIIVLKVRGDPYEKGDFGGLPPPWRFASDGPAPGFLGFTRGDIKITNRNSFSPFQTTRSSRRWRPSDPNPPPPTTMARKKASRSAFSFPVPAPNRVSALRGALLLEGNRTSTPARRRTDASRRLRSRPAAWIPRVSGFLVRAPW